MTLIHRHICCCNNSLPRCKLCTSSHGLREPVEAMATCMAARALCALNSMFMVCTDAARLEGTLGSGRLRRRLFLGLLCHCALLVPCRLQQLQKRHYLPQCITIGFNTLTQKKGFALCCCVLSRAVTFACLVKNCCSMMITVRNMPLERLAILIAKDGNREISQRHQKQAPQR
jgi:hypothetical protein